MQTKISLIETSRLRLVPFSELFLTDLYVAWLNDLEIVKNSQQRFTKHTRQSCGQYVRSLQKDGHCLWAIVEKNAEGKHIGNINATIDRRNSIAEIRILIGDKEVWGRGLGAEAWEAVLDYLFRKNIRKVIAGTLSSNPAMLGIFKKVGMKVEGICSKHYVFDGAEVDMILVAKFNPAIYSENR